MYFRQFWQDNRLQFEKKVSLRLVFQILSWGKTQFWLCMQEGFDKLVVGADYIKLLWVPDTFFVNEKVKNASIDNTLLLLLCVIIY